MALKHDGIKAITGLVGSLQETISQAPEGKYEAAAMQEIGKSFKDLAALIKERYPAVKAARGKIAKTGDEFADMIAFYKRYAEKIDPKLVNDPIFADPEVSNNKLYKYFKALKDEKEGVAPTVKAVKEPKEKKAKVTKEKKAKKDEAAKKAYEELVAAAAPAKPVDESPIVIDSFMDDIIPEGVEADGVFAEPTVAGEDTPTHIDGTDLTGIVDIAAGE